MFDTKKFGIFLARQRKNADLTQSELAEKLNLTRQAISKYELGDSFPDISILIQIAEIFEKNLDELINSGNPTKGEANIIKHSLDEEGRTEINIWDVVNIAPLIKPSILSEVAKKLSAEGIDINHMVSLLHYLNDDSILQMINFANFDSLNAELLGKIIPFLDAASMEAILKKIIEGEIDWRLIKPVLHHMESMSQQLEAAVIDGALPKEVLAFLQGYFFKEQV